MKKKTYIVKYMSDHVRGTITCNYVRLHDNENILDFTRKNYGDIDIYWRLIEHD